MATSRTVRPLIGTCKACASRQTHIQRRFTTSRSLYLEEESSRLPRIANPSLWAGLIPKFLRRSSEPKEPASHEGTSQPAKPKEWNPYTIFIVLGVLVGSNAIQIISLRNDTLNFNRKTDAKLELLREVVQQVKDGEDVDVKRLLGTGDAQQEREWEQVMQELETTDMLSEGKKKREAKVAEKRRIKEEEVRAEREKSSTVKGESPRVENTGRPKFIM